jgi:ribosomal protein L9
MKNKQKNIVITPELVSKFVTGKTTIEEWLAVLAAMREDSDIRKIVTTSLQIHNKMSETDHLFHSPSNQESLSKKQKNKPIESIEKRKRRKDPSF